MLYAALTLAFLFVIGSIMWLRPSPEDHRLAKLRQCAVSQGLRVNWLPSKDTAWLQAPQQKWVRYAYIRPTPKSELGLQRWRKTDAGWKPVGHTAAFPGELTLPEAVTALELTGGDCAVIWSEKGDAEVVNQIATALKRIA